MLIIGITGGTASGKTTLVSKIAKYFAPNELCVISQDSYYNTTDHLTVDARKSISFDHPNAIDFDLLSLHLVQFKKKKTISQPVYSFITHNRTSETKETTAKKIVIVEGILIFNDKRLRNLFDLTIFVDTDANERLQRRIQRDARERGRTADEVKSRYKNTLKPMHDLYIEPYKQKADIIVPYTTENKEIVRKLAKLIRNKMETVL